jgi:hypothetical protein
MNLWEVGWGGMDWIKLTRGKGEVAGICECDNEPSGFIQRGKCLD